MSEEINNNIPENPTITRNEVELPLVKYKILKGDNKDVEYLAPDVSDPNKLEEAIKWIGAQNVANTLQTWTKRLFQSLHLESIDPATGFSWTLFLEKALSFEATGMKMKEMREKLDELQEALNIHIAKAKAHDMADPAWQKVTQELNDQANNMRIMIEQKSRKPSEPEVEASVRS